MPGSSNGAVRNESDLLSKLTSHIVRLSPPLAASRVCTIIVHFALQMAGMCLSTRKYTFVTLNSTEMRLSVKM